MWPFKRKSLLDADTERWHVDNYCWLLRNLARTPTVRESRLILPGSSCYKLGKARGQELAVRIFEQTKAFAGMADWPLALRENGPSDEHHVGYDSALANDPYRLIALFARDLAHRFFLSLGGTPPCAEDERIYLVDIIGCLMGFGVFLANDAVTIVTVREGGKHSVGEYRTDIRSHFSERELIFDLAMFLTGRNIAANDAALFLESHMVGNFKTAMKDVENYRNELQLASEGY